MQNIQIWTVVAVFGSFAILIIKIFVVLHFLPPVKKPAWWSIIPPKEDDGIFTGILNIIIAFRNIFAIIGNLILLAGHIIKTILTALSNKNFVKSLGDLITDLTLSLGVGFIATMLGGHNQIMGLVAATLSLFISGILTIGRMVRNIGRV